MTLLLNPLLWSMSLPLHGFIWSIGEECFHYSIWNCSCSMDLSVGLATALSPAVGLASFTTQAVQELNMFFVFPDNPKGAIGHIVYTEKGILAVEKNKALIPPLWSKTFCWGFEDFTCCFRNYGSEKVNNKKSKHSRN